MKRNPNLTRLCLRRFTLLKSGNTTIPKLAEVVYLADALGLLSPQKDFAKGPQYKPLLFRSLKHGSVSEEFAEIKQQMPHFQVSQGDHLHLIATLMADLQDANDQFPPRSEGYINADTSKNLKAYVKSLSDENELFDLLRALYHSRTLPFSLLMLFLLNKNLRNISRLPFDVTRFNNSEYVKNGWTKINHTELKILLLKKHHDLQQPLEIIKLLKDNFKSEFFPSIRTRLILPFYERIVWKFYFEHIGKGREEHTIKRLDSTRSSFLIWEATSVNSGEILKMITQQHSLSPAQLLFLKVAMCRSVQDKMKHQLTKGKSLLLSGLKRISWRFKVYKAVASNHVTSRAFLCSLIHSLENVVEAHFTRADDRLALKTLLDELKEERLQLMKPEDLGFRNTRPDTYVHETQTT